MGCVHCGKCRKVCPQNAISRNELGYVVLDEDKCVGCGACQKACPFGVISVHPETGKAMKCDGLLGQNSGGIAASLRPYLPHRRIDADGLTSKLRKTPETVVVSGAFLYGLEP